MSRKRNFEQNEILKLLALYKEDADTLNSKFNNSVTSRKKKDKWAEITASVNSLGKQQRSTDELKHKWKDLLTRAKKDHSNRRRPKTGGGPQPQEGPYTDLVLEIIGQSSVTLDGISTGGESFVEGAEEQEGNTDPPETAPNSERKAKRTTEAVNEGQPPQLTSKSSSPEGPATKRAKRSDQQETREELHRDLLQAEIKKVNVEIKKIELEMTKLEKENTKLDLEIWLLQQQQQFQMNLDQQPQQQMQLQQQIMQQQQQIPLQGIQTDFSADQMSVQNNFR